MAARLEKHVLGLREADLTIDRRLVLLAQHQLLPEAARQSRTARRSSGLSLPACS